ncbi:hypothetical protein [Weissella oryzae]|nr:hypothetical protein [Weissella oryzae]
MNAEIFFKTMNNEIMSIHMFTNGLQKKNHLSMTRSTVVVTLNQYKSFKYSKQNSAHLIGCSQIFYQITFDLLRYLKFIKKFEDSEHLKKVMSINSL